MSYFIWRLTDREPWRAYQTGRRYSSWEKVLVGVVGEFSAWDSEDYAGTLAECKRLNAEQTPC